MSFTVQKFSALRIFSNDLQKSRDWYKALFGIAPIEDSVNFVSFSIADFTLDITVPDSKNSYSTGGSIGYIQIDNLELLLAKVNELGGIVYRGPLQVSEIQRTILQIQDPFGNVLGFEAPIIYNK